MYRYVEDRLVLYIMMLLGCLARTPSVNIARGVMPGNRKASSLQARVTMWEIT